MRMPLAALELGDEVAGKVKVDEDAVACRQQPSALDRVDPLSDGAGAQPEHRRDCRECPVRLDHPR